MKIEKLGIWLAALVMIGCLSLAVSSCKDDSDSSMNYGIGTITGTITDDYNAPLEGVAVRVDSTDIT